LPLRQKLGQWVNLRPVRLRPGIPSPLANRGAAEIDMICVRENSEGEYCGMGGRLHGGTPYELAEQTGVFTRNGIERIARYAFTLAESRPRKMLASATKSNALQHAMVMWDEVVAGVAKEFPKVELKKYHVDALCARMVTHPHTLDVIVASNLFGDIITDIGSAISGSARGRAWRQHHPRPHDAVDVGADSRLCPGHRRKGHRQPDRRDLGRGDDARPPRRARRARPHPGIDRGCPVTRSGQNPGSGRSRDDGRDDKGSHERDDSRQPATSVRHGIWMFGVGHVLLDVPLEAVHASNDRDSPRRHGEHRRSDRPSAPAYE